MTVAPQRAGETGRIAAAILEGVGHHRLLLTRQVRELHADGVSRQRVHRVLAGLRAAGLVAGTPGERGRLLWHLTEQGADALEAVPGRAETRRKVIAPEQAAGPLREHTIAVNDAGLAFLRAARERGDEFGPFDWRHEVAHSLGPPPGRRTPEQLICDAVLDYQLDEGGGQSSIVYRFVEVDRANRSAADLARQIARYGRLHRRRVPAEAGHGSVLLWERLYPVFPAVLLVLAGRSRERLEDRRRAVLALCRQDPDLAGSPEVEVSVCLLADLDALGPFAPICRMVAEPEAAVDWLGEGAR